MWLLGCWLLVLDTQLGGNVGWAREMGMSVVVGNGEAAGMSSGREVGEVAGWVKNGQKMVKIWSGSHFSH